MPKITGENLPSQVLKDFGIASPFLYLYLASFCQVTFQYMDIEVHSKSGINANGYAVISNRVAEKSRLSTYTCHE
jgi:hypothetical protein